MYIPNQEITIQIYKPMYTVGDVVYIPNKNNKFGIYLKIISSHIDFSEFSVIDGNAQIPSITEAGYFGQIMLGSNYDVQSIPNEKALVGYLEIDALYVDSEALFVTHKGCDYILFDDNTPMSAIDEILANLEKQQIETKIDKE